MKCRLSQNIFLTGFMGAGKSTTGRSLARLTGCLFHDLDSMIVAREQRSIKEIFRTDGEDYFRHCETMVLSSLKQHDVAVYATGGGIVVRPENRAMMRRIGKIVYLQAGWETLRKRLRGSVDRPLVDRAKDWHDLERLWLSRLPHYRDADLVIDTDAITPQQVAQEIVAHLHMENRA